MHNTLSLLKKETKDRGNRKKEGKEERKVKS
jgi:hypothetical protein